MNSCLSHQDFGLETLADIVRYSCNNNPDDIAFAFRKGKDEIKKISFGELKQDIYSVSSFLYDNNLASDNIALIGENSVEWITVYLGVTVGGGIIVPIDRELSPDDVEDIIRRSGSKAVFFSKSYRKKIQNVMDENSDMIFVEMTSLADISLRYPDAKEPKYKPLLKDLATIVYTSGTTGRSKGVMLTHGNLTSNAVSSLDTIKPFSRIMCVLPLHHTLGLVTNVLDPMIIHGEVFICKNLRKLNQDIEISKPDIIVLVPVIAELIYKKTIEGIKNQGREKVFRRAVRISDFLLKLHIDLRKRLFDDIINKFGGELRTIISGGAPLSSELQHSFHSIGIEVYNGYGITECSPIVSVSNQGKNKIGTVGLPLNCNKVRITNKRQDGTGNIEVKGSNVMVGYFDDEEQTKLAFDDGWFITGDIGKFDEEGYLLITGREKNLIILSNGKNVSPEEIESKLLLHDEIDEVVVYDENEKICAEIYSERADKEKIYAIVDEYNRESPAYKNIEKIIIRENEFEKTTTMKIKRTH